MSEFKIKTEKFEGPLELLLNLIEKRKFFINDISLSKVADEYLEYARNYENQSLKESADFILIASTLILIKSKSLLPNLELTAEEEGSIDNLEKRLKLYKIYKEASLEIAKKFGEKNIFFAGQKKFTPVFAPDNSMTVQNILEAIGRVIQAIPKVEETPKAIIKKVISLEEMIESLTERVKSSLKMSFRDFSGRHKGEKVNVIVSFLAMLELVKQGIIHANQENHWSDIEMETESISVPKYN